MKKAFFITIVLATFLAVLYQTLQIGTPVRRMSKKGEHDLNRVALASVGTQAVGLPAKRVMQALLPDSPLTVSLVDVANNFLNARRQEWQIQDHHELRPAVHESPLSTEVKYAVYQDGVPIVGLEIRIRIGKGTEVESVDNRYLPLKKVDVNDVLLSEANETVERLRSLGYAVDNKAQGEWSRVLVPVEGTDVPEVAYVITARDMRRRSVELLVRATDNQILRRMYPRSEF